MVPILVILLLIVVNGIFVMAEMALVSSRKPRLQQWANEGSSSAQTALAKPMNFFSRLGAPIVRVLGSSTRVVLRTFSLKPSDEPPVTEEEIKVMMEQGAEAGVFEEAEHDIVKSIFKLGDRAVSALMKPRRDVVWLDIDDPFPENQQKLASSQYSRFPVAQGTLDNVIGIVQAKDLLTRCLAGAKIDLKATLRPPLFVPEGLPALKLLEMF